MIKLPRIRIRQGECKFIGHQFAAGIFEWDLANVYTTKPTIHIYPNNLKTYTLAVKGGIWQLHFIATLAHELVHWGQWVRQRPCSEKWPSRINVCLHTLFTVPTTVYDWNNAEWSVPNRAVRDLQYKDLVAVQSLRAVAASGPRPSERVSKAKL